MGSAPAARGLGGGAAGRLARIFASVRAGGSNPDRGHGRVKPGSGKGQVKPGSGTRAGQIRNGRSAKEKKENKRKNKNLWLQPHSPESGVTAVRTVVITSLLATAVITAVGTVVPEGVVATKV